MSKVLTGGESPVMKRKQIVVSAWTDYFGILNLVTEKNLCYSLFVFQPEVGCFFTLFGYF